MTVCRIGQRCVCGVRMTETEGDDRGRRGKLALMLVLVIEVTRV